MRDSTRTAHRVGLPLLILVLWLIFPGLRIAWADSAGAANRISSNRSGETLTVDRIVVELDSFRLYTFDNDRLVSQYPISVGMDTSPTPTGTFRVVNKLKNPWYTPEDKPAEAPGPDNPLGTRWMGIDKPTYGLHGTRAPDSIGTRSSEGCIRLRNADAERLYRRVRRGTRVVIRRTLETPLSPSVPAVSVADARRTRQGSYASLPGGSAAVPKTGSVVEAGDDAPLTYAQCRLRVPLDVPFLASCFLNGNNCPPTVEPYGSSARPSMNPAVQNFPDLSTEVLGEGESKTLPARKEVFASAGASEARSLPVARVASSEVSRSPSFSSPGSCGAKTARLTDKTEKVVCFILSGPSASRHPFSPGSLSTRAENPVGIFHRGTESSPPPKPSRSPNLSGEVLPVVTADGSGNAAGTTYQSRSEVNRVGVSFPDLDGGKHCAGSRKPKPREGSPAPRNPSENAPTLQAQTGSAVGNLLPTASFFAPNGSRLSLLSTIDPRN